MPALLIIFFCGAVQSALRVSSRMLAHSHQAGRWRFSGLLFHRAAIRKPQLGPTAPSLFLLAGQPFAERWHQVVMGQLVVFFASYDLRAGSIFRIDSFRVGRRDEADFAVENANKIIESFGRLE